MLLRWVASGLGRLLEGNLESLQQKLKHSVKYGPDGDPYLCRFYILRREWRYAPSVYLHYFYRGDEDEALHNHPWGFSCSLILTNGYMEDRRYGTSIERRVLPPGSINVIRANDFHRVDLIDPSKGAWTLFFAGPRVQDWGFWGPLDNRYTQWQQFINERGNEWDNDDNRVPD